MANISQIQLPNGTTYDINAITVNGHTVNASVPSDAKFTDSYTTITGTNDPINGFLVTAGSRPSRTSLDYVSDTGAAELIISDGRQMLQLGLTHNDEGSGGGIRFANNGVPARGYTTVIPSATATASLALPSSSGTIALMSDIPNVPSWALASSKPTYTASEVGAAASNHTHTTTIAASTATNQITLAFGSKYSLNAGETSYIFTMPSLPIYDGTVV